jgi:ATP-dependent DNA ligase
MLLNEDNLPIDLLLDKEKLIPYIEGKYNGWYYQVKANGVRGVVSVKDGKITAIRDRKDLPIFQNYPELKEVRLPNVKEALLDVEVVILDDNGKSHYYNEYDEKKALTQAGIQLRSLSIKGEEIIKQHPVSIVIFDVLKLNGERLITKSYKERYAKLLTITEADNIKIAKNYTNFREIWEKVLNEDLEGAVCKNPNSVYEIDTRSKNYIKIKNYKVDEVEVEETEINEKGLRVSGKTREALKVDFQMAGGISLDKGAKVRIKYLEKIGGFGGRLTQPTVA